MNQSFISIRKNFVKLLTDGNNSYKYVRQYREKINKYIQEDSNKKETDIVKQLLYMLSIIYTEKEKCRFHTNDNIAAKIEKVILIDSLKILKEEKHKEQKIAEINEVLTKTIDETLFSKFNSKYGFPVTVDTNEITEITNENVKDTYINFSNIRKLLDLKNNDYKETEDYLFCLYYFSKTPEFETN
jgi:hypothetical protein